MRAEALADGMRIRAEALSGLDEDARGGACGWNADSRGGACDTKEIDRCPLARYIRERQHHIFTTAKSLIMEKPVMFMFGISSASYSYSYVD